MADNLIIEILLKYARQEELEGEEYSLLQKWHARWGGGKPLSNLVDDPEWLRICLYWQHGMPDRSDWRELKRLIAATGDPLPASRIYARWVTGGVAAAALILVVGIAWFARTPGPGTPDSRPMVDHFFYAATTGPYKLVLPDGSWVRLEKGASLRYSPALRGTKQPVTLTGDAWFSVAKNNEAPLSISLADSTVVDVLGTEFHISSVAGGTLTKVCVYRGAVRVQQGPKSVILKDSDEVTVQNNRLLPKKRMEDFDALLAGTDIDQRFHFDNCSLTEAVQQIADHYHVDVSNPTHTPGIPVKGDPAQSLPLKELLKDIELIENGNAYLGLSDKTILISNVPIK